ncbi:VOC family protein [Microbacterium sp. ET2]|uniref:VOC family protein n=1 Tax=Microbacterium albipurpureum TaxID=3050384 RepID=UPI00259CBA99|nr:VOC family protein [Microbacterium sp. ET2 (Ac-2212)]WJL94892.1 VOC family protein [Microbacterium sp. ET2 (Ac-2212)]
MITGIHTIVYSDDPPATRAFFRDAIGWDFIETSPGWLIFASGPSEGGVHPLTWPGQEKPYGQRHEISLICDDLDATLTELQARGVSFDASTVWEREYGRGLDIPVPGIGALMLYQPSYAPAWEGGRRSDGSD